MSATPAPTPGPRPGAPLSPDGMWWWDGTDWLPVHADAHTVRLERTAVAFGQVPAGAYLSRDGRSWWNGTAWRPINQRNFFMTAPGVAVLLVLGVLAVAMTLGVLVGVVGSFTGARTTSG